MSPLATPALALVLTVAAETLVLWALLRRPLPALLLYALLVNGLTQPPAAFLAVRVPGAFLPVEAAVTLAEAPLLAALLRLPARRALLLSLAANAASAALGLLAFG